MFVEGLELNHDPHAACFILMLFGGIGAIRRGTFHIDDLESWTGHADLIPVLGGMGMGTSANTKGEALAWVGVLLFLGGGDRRGVSC